MTIERPTSNNDTETLKTYRAQLELFLRERGWERRDCSRCERQYYAKGVSQNCGDSTCCGSFEFLQDVRRERSLTLPGLEIVVRNHFENAGFELHPPKSILNEGGTTLFTSAGVQLLDDWVLKDANPPRRPLYVSQPSVRTQHLDSIGEGNSLSFVNICTEVANATPETHFVNLDHWLDCLSRLGLYVGDITLHERRLIQQWGDVTLKSEIIAIFYKGLEIGDGNYNYGFTPQASNATFISDFGFGLERLAWILRKGSYFDGVGPLSESLKGNSVLQELIKTLTLLSSYGLEPSNKDRGYRFRLFAKKLVALTFPEHCVVFPLASYYYNYWKNFADLLIQQDLVVDIIQREYDRNYNQRVNLLLSAKSDPNCPTEEYLLKLLMSRVSRDGIAQILRGN
ncbi:MAG: hypothetical protein G01um10145_600 [Microgenomates group bacterium Gr01-1014_5]|nr:MAG: hypothetical protein G01um10145_600 [Microgenomates group bacterium Gr01-1014_5]